MLLLKSNAKDHYLIQLFDELQDEESVKHLSESELLKRHVDRAKKVRAR